MGGVASTHILYEKNLFYQKFLSQVEIPNQLWSHERAFAFQEYKDEKRLFEFSHSKQQNHSLHISIREYPPSTNYKDFFLSFRT
jgi:hypothetical protein